MSSRHGGGGHHHRSHRHGHGHEDRWERDDMRDYLDSRQSHGYEPSYPRRNESGIGRPHRHEPRISSGGSHYPREHAGRRQPPTNMSLGRWPGHCPHHAFGSTGNHHHHHHRASSPESFRGRDSISGRYPSDEEELPEEVERRFEDHHRRYHERSRDRSSSYERSPAGRHRSVSRGLPVHHHHHHHRSGPRPYPHDGRSMASERSLQRDRRPSRREDRGWSRAEEMPMHERFDPRGRVSPESIGNGDNDDDLDDVIRRIEALRAESDVEPSLVSQTNIANLNKIKIGPNMLASDGKATCSICMEDVPVGEEVTELSCKHWFHGRCISVWLSSNDTCPHCRRTVNRDSTVPTSNWGEEWVGQPDRGGWPPSWMSDAAQEEWRLYESSIGTANERPTPRSW